MKNATLIALFILIAGCDVQAPDIYRAIEACETNGGLVSVEDDFKGTRVHCKNGARFFLPHQPRG